MLWERRLGQPWIRPWGRSSLSFLRRAWPVRQRMSGRSGGVGRMGEGRRGEGGRRGQEEGRERRWSRDVDGRGCGKRKRQRKRGRDRKGKGEGRKLSEDGEGREGSGREELEWRRDGREEREVCGQVWDWSRMGEVMYRTVNCVIAIMSLFSTTCKVMWSYRGRMRVGDATSSLFPTLLQSPHLAEANKGSCECCSCT